MGDSRRDQRRNAVQSTGFRRKAPLPVGVFQGSVDVVSVTVDLEPNSLTFWSWFCKPHEVSLRENSGTSGKFVGSS